MVVVAVLIVVIVVALVVVLVVVLVVELVIVLVRIGWKTVFDAQSPNQDIPRHHFEFTLRFPLFEFNFIVLLGSM